MSDIAQLAEENMKTRFVDNPCRGIVCGLNKESQPVQLSWIMGRSPNSQNRVYVIKQGILHTEAADPRKVEDPSLIIYNAMNFLGIEHVVSNGDQTDTLIAAIRENLFKSTTVDTGIFRQALDTRYCEPDAPTFTPRITGYTVYGQTKTYMSILRAKPDAKAHWKAAAENAKQDGITRDSFKKPDLKDSAVTELYNNEIGRRAELNHKEFPTDRNYFELELQPGFGYCLTTYKPGSKELPSFEGTPFAVPINGLIEHAMSTFWERLEPEWRVAIAAKQININMSSILKINRYEKVV